MACEMTFFDPLVGADTIQTGRFNDFDSCGESYEVYVGFTIRDDSTTALLLPQTVSGQDDGDWGLVYSVDLSWTLSTPSRTNEVSGNRYSGISNPKTWVRYFLKYSVVAGASDSSGTMSMKLYRGMMTNENVMANPGSYSTQSDICIDFTTLSQVNGAFEFKVKAPCILGIYDVVGLAVLATHTTSLNSQTPSLKPYDLVALGGGRNLRRESGMLYTNYMLELNIMNGEWYQWRSAGHKGYQFQDLNRPLIDLSPRGYASREMALSITYKIESNTNDVDHTFDLYQETAAGEKTLIFRINLVQDIHGPDYDLISIYTMSYVDETDNTKPMITTTVTTVHPSEEGEYELSLRYIFSEKSLESTGTLITTQHQYLSNTDLYVYVCMVPTSRDQSSTLYKEFTSLLGRTKVRNADRINVENLYIMQVTLNQDLLYYPYYQEHLVFQGGVDSLMVNSLIPVKTLKANNPYPDLTSYVDGCDTKNLYTGFCSKCNQAFSALDTEHGTCQFGSFGDKCLFKYKPEVCAHCDKSLYYSDSYRRGGCVIPKTQGCPQGEGSYYGFTEDELTLNHCSSCPMNARTCHSFYSLTITLCSPYSTLSNNQCICNQAGCELCFNEACEICSVSKLLHKEYNFVTGKIDSLCLDINSCQAGWIPHFNSSILQFCFKDRCTIGYAFDSIANYCVACEIPTQGDCGTQQVTSSIGEKYVFQQTSDTTVQIISQTDPQFEFCLAVNATNDCVECVAGKVVRRLNLYRTICGCPQGTIYNPTTKNCDNCPFGCKIEY